MFATWEKLIYIPCVVNKFIIQINKQTYNKI